MTWPYLFHLVFSSLLSSFFSHTQQFPFFFNSREINQNSLKIFYLLRERALLGLSASAWVMQTYAGTPRARMNPNTSHILAESPWGTSGTSKYTRIFDVCALCQAHTYTVYTVGKWLWALLILTVTFLCVLSCHHFNLPLIVLLCVCVFVCVSFCGYTFMCHGAVGVCTCEFVCLCP